MKRQLYMAAAWILAVLLLVGCEASRPADIQTENIAVGVIETKQNKEKSRILFLDSDMNELGSLALDYATVGNIYYKPLIVNNTLYIIPQGIATKKDAETVLEIDLSDLSIKKHSIEQLAMNSVAASETAVYTCNTLSGVSYINKCDKETGGTENINIPSTYISKLLYDNGCLYAFGTTQTDEVMLSELLIYDGDLNLLEKIDITECGATQYKAIAHEGYIYFTSGTDKNDNPTNTVGKVNTADYSLEIIELNENHPLDLAVHNGKLFISHFNVTQLIGGGLSVYDLETKELTEYSFEHGAEQMSIANDKLYILTDWKIYVYDIGSMELTDTASISPMDKDYSYLSGLFVIGE